MSVATKIDPADVAHVLKGLLGREVVVTPRAEQLVPHDGTFRGLVTNENRLVGAIASDLAFAHGTGAALAVIPASTVAEAGDEPDELWLEFYAEVANVLSRVINEESPVRLRIDPDLVPTIQDFHAVMAGSTAAWYDVKVEGYADGKLVFYTML